MRFRQTLAALAMFFLAACAAYLSATAAARVIEDRSLADVERVLGLFGFDWAEVQTDGLQVFIAGEAPDEPARFQAMREAGRVVDAARIIDMMSIHQPEPIRPPKFSVEILRNDDGISLIGLVPTEIGQDQVVRRVSDIAGSETVVDLLDEASFPVPPLWEQSFNFGMVALTAFDRAKISVSAGNVEIVGLAESGAEKRKLETDLRVAAPEGVAAQITITAPRPVVSPYTLRFVIDDHGPRFDACTTDTQRGVDTIIAAARTAGLMGQARCTIALGIPSPDWDKAAVLAIQSLGELGGGSVTFSDADVTFVGTTAITPEEFDRVVGSLRSRLPDVFSLQTVLPEPEPQDGDAAVAGPPEFIATRSPEGIVQLRGPVPDERTRTATISLARARFGIDQINDALRIREDVPDGWALRVFASLEALAELKNGVARVKPDTVQISGDTGNPDAQAEIARVLSENLKSDDRYDIDVTYHDELDPVALKPTPEECVSSINAVLAEKKITFAPSSADIDVDARETVEKIVGIMKDCEDVPMEVGGHTDSQGREIMNKELSQARADAVVNALLGRRVLTTNLHAVGCGEEQPIADNETEEGREANRRIEFSLWDPAKAEQQQAGEDAASSQGDPADDAETDAEIVEDPGATDSIDAAETETDAAPADQTETPNQ